MKGGTLPGEEKLALRVVLELGLGDEIAEEEADHIGAVLELERIGPRTADAIADLSGRAAAGELLKPAKWGALGASANRQRHLMPPSGPAVAATHALNHVCRSATIEPDR